MNGIKSRAFAVLGALLIFTSAGIGAISYTGPGAPSGEADAINLVSPTEENALALGYYSTAGGINPMGSIFDNSVPEPVITGEKNETKANIIQSYATQRQNNEILLDSFNNFLQDTEQPATLVGMNEYVRQLNNESAEAEARNEAKQAVLDYYATKEIQRNKQWAVNVETLATSLQKEEDSNISTGSGFLYEEADLNPATSGTVLKDVEVTNVNATTTVTLVNGTQRTIPAPELTVNTEDEYQATHDFTGKISPYNNFTASGYGAVSETKSHLTINSFKTKSVPSTSGARLLFTPDWTVQTQLESQTSNLQSRMDNIVNSTYAGYQQGEINDSDLISPLQRTRQYSPTADADYGSFTLATLTSMGYSPPTNLSGTKTMNITANGTEHQGILLSDGLPTGGSFDVGTTYNTSNIDGQQYIQTDRGLVKIEDAAENQTGTDFTISSVIGTGGEELNRTSVEYTNPSYTTTNISDYQETMDELRTLQAEINARQENLSAASGGLFAGGDLLGGLGLADMSDMEIVVLLGAAGVLLLLYSNREDDRISNYQRDD